MTNNSYKLFFSMPIFADCHDGKRGRHISYSNTKHKFKNT